MNIVFRVDGSSTLGLRHYYRCTTLALALRSQGHNCQFISQCYPKKLSETLVKSGVDIVKLPQCVEMDQAQDARWSCEHLAQKHVDWLIIDHYGLDACWHKAMKGVVKKRLVMDDLANRPYDCEVLLDSTYSRQASAYRGLCPENTEFLLGSEYMLLREQFSEVRHTLPQHHAQIKRLFIHFGAVDHLNMSAKTLNALRDLGWEGEIDLVLSSEAMYLKQIETMVANHQNWRLHVDIEHMAELMGQCDAAVGAGSTNSWERCCLGLPSLVVQVADNQSDIIASLKQAGAIFESHAETLTKDLSVFLNRDLTKMREMAFKVCDGLGIARTLAFLNQ